MPAELLDYKPIYHDAVFNRYMIKRISDTLNVEQLAELVLQQNESTLVVLNTIADTQVFYQLLEGRVPAILLNTHFPDRHRKLKLRAAIRNLAKEKKFVLISTMLIEAGVDIDFPIIFRDMCPFPSLIQTAGRTNRNGMRKQGILYLFELIDAKGQRAWKKIYQQTEDYISFTDNNISSEIIERDLLKLHEERARKIGQSLIVGKFVCEGGSGHSDAGGTEVRLCDRIPELNYPEVAKFQLIQKAGEDWVRYFIPRNQRDRRFEKLAEIVNTDTDQNLHERLVRRARIKHALKQMSDSMVEIRIKQGESCTREADSVLGINKLPLSHYSHRSGIIPTPLNMNSQSGQQT